MVNNVNIVGEIFKIHNVVNVDKSSKYIDIVLEVKNNILDETYSYIDCRLKDNKCDWLYRNCKKGNIVRLDGYLKTVTRYDEEFDKFEVPTMVIVNNIFKIDE